MQVHQSPELSPLNVRALLRDFGLRPNRQLGQNFIVDRRALGRVLAAAKLSGSEVVLEIGAGLGALTQRLAEICFRVITIEYDFRLVPILETVLGGFANVEIIRGNFLDLDLATLIGDKPYFVVANIPYNITSAVIRRLLESEQQAQRVVLTVQKEVAERITAGPGDMSLLALSVQLYGQPELRSVIPATAFYPKPKVDSAVLRVDLHQTPLIPREWIDPFFRIVRAGFGQKRKQLHNALSHGLQQPQAMIHSWLEAASVSPGRRAQELSLETWISLTRVFLENMRSQ